MSLKSLAIVNCGKVWQIQPTQLAFRRTFMKENLFRASVFFQRLCIFRTLWRYKNCIIIIIMKVYLLICLLTYFNICLFVTAVGLEITVVDNGVTDTEARRTGQGRLAENVE